MKFMDWLNEGIANTSVDDQVCPKEPITDEEGELVVVLPDELKKLYSFKDKIRKDALKLSERLDYDRVKLTYSDDSDEMREAYEKGQRELSALKEQIRFLNDFFWRAVKFEFPELSNKDLHLHAGWKILATEPQHGYSLLQLIGALPFPEE